MCWWCYLWRYLRYSIFLHFRCITILFYNHSEIDDLKLFYSDRDDKDQVFFDLYYMKKDLDINTLVLQEEEVESIEWDSLEDIQALRDAGKFKRAHAEAFDRLLKLMNNN